MYFVRWLMGHPIIAIWVLGGIAILLTNNAGNVASHDTKESNVSHAVEVTEDAMMKHAVAKTMAENESSKKEEQEVSSVETAIDDSKVTVNNTIDGVKSSSKQIKVVEQVQAVTNIVDVKDGKVKNNTGVELEKDESVNTPTTKVEITDTEKLSPEKTTISEPDNQDQNVVTATPKFPEGAVGLEKTSTEDMLLMAREAYWNNGLEEATEIYAELIKLHPNVMGYKGELGNVYWRLGYPKKAAELYSEIALPMIEIGDADRVSNMVGFIGLFYPERAATIKQRIMTLQSGGIR